MRVLFLSHFFWPETGAASKRITGLAEQIAVQGHEVGVVTGMPNYPTGQVEVSYANKLWLYENYKNIKVYRSWIYASAKKGSLRRLLNYFSFVLSSLIHLPRLLGKYDVVVTSSPPLFLGISGVIYSRLLKLPLVFDIRDIWPEVAVEMGELKRKSVFYKLAKLLEEWIYKKASLISVVTEGKKNALVARGIEKEKIILISNGFDMEFLDFPVDKNLRKNLGLEDKFIVLYAGIIGKAQGLDIILTAAEKCDDQRLHFLLVGEGVEKDKLIAIVEKKGLKNITFLSGQPHERILSFLKMADIALIPLKTSDLSDSIPSKLYEALGAGCPVILAAQGDSVKLLEQAQGGIAIEPNNGEKLYATLKDLLMGKYNLNYFGLKGSQHVLKLYTREKIAKNFFLQLETKIIKINQKVARGYLNE